MTSTSIPVRVQRTRAKNFRLQKTSPNGLQVIYVGRPTKWGNPFKIDNYGHKKAIELFIECLENPHMAYVYLDEVHATIEHNRFTWMKNNINQLKDKNLACFCKLTDLCHADILLKLANQNAASENV